MISGQIWETTKTRAAMKKINFILAMLVVATVSCQKEEAMQPEGAQQEGKYTIVLDGSSAPATKLDMLKDDKNYILHWSTADKVKLYSTSINGVDAGFTEYAEGDKGRAFFQTNADVAGAEELVVVYPNTLTYADGKVTGTIPAVQAQSISGNQDPIEHPRGSAFHLGTNTLAYGKTTIDPSLAVEGVIPVSFTISQKAAFVMVELVAEDEFLGYEVVGAKLYAKGEKLAGTATYDTATDIVTVADEGASDVVGVEYKVAQAVVADGKYDLYFAAAPRAADATGDLTLIVTLKKGYETVTLPHKLPAGFKIESGKVSYIKLPISLAVNSYEWFEPVDVRDMVGGWAYGPQNTYYVQNSKTKNISVKARGEFTKVQEPLKCGFIRDRYPYNKTPMTVVSETVNADYSIDVTAAGSTPWAILAIYGKNEENEDQIIWSYFICMYNSSNPIYDVTYTSDIVMMDRALGQVEQTATALAKAANNNKLDNNIPYFQWGKKDPVLFGNKGGSGSTAYDFTDYFNAAKATGVSFETTIQNPGTFYASGGPNGLHWGDGKPNPALWGGIASSNNFDETNKGHKTIYDPCPEGYRVPDPCVFKELLSKMEVREVQLYHTPNSDPSKADVVGITGTDGSNETTDQRHANQKADWVKNSGLYQTSVLAYKGDGFEDLWPYFGWKNNSTSYGSRAVSNKWAGAIYWGNCIDATSKGGGNKGTSIEYAYYTYPGVQHGSRLSTATAVAATVRCQKEL